MPTGQRYWNTTSRLQNKELKQLIKDVYYNKLMVLTIALLYIPDNQIINAVFITPPISLESSISLNHF